MNDASKIRKSRLVGDQRYSDRLTYDGTWENNLFNFVTTVLPKLTKELPRPFKMMGTERDDDTPQHKAVREAMTNAIIHANLMLNGVLKVEKYDDQFVFTNPGLLRLPVEQIYAGNETRARNQRIQNMFRMIGLGENLGSGFPLILSAWNEKHWMKPELIEQRELMQVKLVLTIETKDALGNGISNGETGGEIQLTERQKDIVAFLRVDGDTTAIKMAKVLGVSKRTVDREFSFLRENGFIKKETKDNRSPWVVIER